MKYKAVGTYPVVSENSGWKYPAAITLMFGPILFQPI
jgi:hypothetical protein